MHLLGQDGRLISWKVGALSQVIGRVMTVLAHNVRRICRQSMGWKWSIASRFLPSRRMIWKQVRVAQTVFGLDGCVSATLRGRVWALSYSVCPCRHRNSRVPFDAVIGRIVDRSQLRHAWAAGPSTRRRVWAGPRRWRAQVGANSLFGRRFPGRDWRSLLPQSAWHPNQTRIRNGGRSCRRRSVR